MANGNKANKKQNKTQTKKNVQEKSNVKQCKSSSSCPWILGIFALLFSIGGLIAYDTHLHGGVFAKSRVGVLLKDAGALPYVETAWTKTLSNSARGYQWTINNVPVYFNCTCEVLKPYAELSRDLSIVGWNSFKRGLANSQVYILDKTPIVVNYIDGYVPGLPRKIQDASVAAWDILTATWMNIYKVFTTQIFVGKLSPESLCQAFNQTQIVAAEYVRWFHQKVDTYAKMQ